MKVHCTAPQGVAPQVEIPVFSDSPFLSQWKAEFKNIRTVLSCKNSFPVFNLPTELFSSTMSQRVKVWSKRVALHTRLANILLASIVLANIRGHWNGGSRKLFLHIHLHCSFKLIVLTR